MMPSAEDKTAAMPTAEALEAPDRELDFRFVGVASEAEANSIVDALIPVVRELAGSDDGPGLVLGHLRLMTFTNDLPAEVFYWQRQLDRPEGITDGEFQAVGKAISWRSDAGETHSVALFNLNIGFGLLDRKPLAQALVAHELAHVHYAPILRSAFGDVVDRRAFASDWPIVRRQLAIWCFDEFLAEHVACRFMDEECFDLSLETLVQLAAATRLDVRECVAAYRHDGDHGGLWGSTVTSVSAYANQLGRVAGLGQVLDEPIDGLDAGHAGGRGHLQSLSAAFEPILGLSLDDLDTELLEPAERVIEEIFHSLGVVPEWDQAKEQFGIDVPFWPGDRERAEDEYYDNALRQQQAAINSIARATQAMTDALAALRP